MATRRVASRIPRRDSIPDAPDILPAFPTDAVEKGELQVVRLIAFPAIGDVHHVARFQPFVFVHHGHEGILILPPRHDVPSQCLVRGTALRFEHERMANLVGGKRVSKRHAVLRVSVDAVRSDFRHRAGNCIWPRHARIPRALIPHHHRKQHAYPAMMEIRNHLPHARYAARHGADHIVLVAVVDSHVRIRGPDEHRINSAVSLFQVIEVTIYRVAVRHRIVEITVLHHHLRLEKAGLGPLECGQVVAQAIVADTNPALVAPMTNVGQPGIMLILSARRRSTFPCTFHIQAAGSGDLLMFGTKVGVLCRNGAGGD